MFFWVPKSGDHCQIGPRSAPAQIKSIKSIKEYLRVLRHCAVLVYSYKHNLKNFKSETLTLLVKTYSTTALLINYFSLKTKSGQSDVKSLSCSIETGPSFIVQ